MGCSDSKESDQMAVGRHSKGQSYKEQAEDAASMLAGTGLHFEFIVRGSIWLTYVLQE